MGLVRVEKWGSGRGKENCDGKGDERRTGEEDGEKEGGMNVRRVERMKEGIGEKE